MNILIPHHWLLEHLETKASPKKIAEFLSLCGPTFESINTIAGEPVYDIEVTTNRVDSMSVRGIAREAAAILPQFGIKAQLKPLKLPLTTSQQPLGITIKNNPKLCHRILAVKLENVHLGQSPSFIKKRLEQVGQRPLNNAIDITNFVMWELGHPVHVFDYDRLTNKTIIVREGKQGETVITLDNKKHLLHGGEVVFDDGIGTIIDIPGIMGTKNTVVTSQTKNILFLIDSVKADKIRFASMTHSLRSQAAILNEKHVDPELGAIAMLRGIQLFKKITTAKVASSITDIYPNQTTIRPTNVSQQIIDTYLGVSLKPQTIINILTTLGCKVKHQKQSFSITPPSWRAEDLQIPQDYVEEVARIHGYHNLPSIVMPTPIPDNPPEDDFQLEHTIKTWLADWGYTETYSFSMVSKTLAEQSQIPLASHLKLKNPLTDDWVYMRRSLIPSLIEIVATNQHRDQLSLFEMANLYHPQKSKLPNHELHLTLISDHNYPHLKGTLDSLLRKLFIEEINIIPTKKAPKTFSSQRVAVIHSGKIPLGYIGSIANSNLYVLDLFIKPLFTVSSRHPRFIPLINTPPIIEDLKKTTM